jgi:hypothetical protein
MKEYLDKFQFIGLSKSICFFVVVNLDDKIPVYCESNEYNRNTINSNLYN